MTAHVEEMMRQAEAETEDSESEDDPVNDVEEIAGPDEMIALAETPEVIEEPAPTFEVATEELDEEPSLPPRRRMRFDFENTAGDAA